MTKTRDNLTGGRSLEEKYFREKEKELIDRLKRKSARDESRKALSQAVGVTDEAILQTLEEMGYDREVVTVLHFFPLVAVAWADGELSGQERAKILESARAWGVQEGTAADAKLKQWLDSQPSATTIRHTLTVIRDIVQFRGAVKQEQYRADITKLCEAVAEASGGVLGLGRRISPAERQVIDRINRELATRHQAAADKLLGQP